jgi:hypothetical protein
MEQPKQMIKEDLPVISEASADKILDKKKKKKVLVVDPSAPISILKN